MTIKEINNLKSVPAAVGPYSQAAIAGNTVYLSGQIALDPEKGEMVGGTIADEANQVMKNLKNVLAGLDLNFSNVAKSTILLADIHDFKEINAIYEKWLDGAKPARATYAVKDLPLGAKIEIEMIAIKS